ncbi:hypothetical protein [Halovenus sp. HT40]|uniref:hypothetical protein n=1 Tax=Halovenus sp. HT40 TaxID=3126691 RepID=UPI00300EFCEB
MSDRRERTAFFAHVFQGAFPQRPLAARKGDAEKGGSETGGSADPGDVNGRLREALEE